MTTVEIITEFTELINVEQEYTLSELKSMLSDIYKTKTGKKVAAKKIAKKADAVPSDEDEKPKKKGRPAKAPKLDANGDVKKKREPSAYNIFIKEKYAEFKQSNPEMTTKEIMLQAAADWSAKKEADKKVVEEEDKEAVAKAPTLVKVEVKEVEKKVKVVKKNKEGNDGEIVSD